MASKRDLVEANSFNRRRLVTAFVSGAPGGREVDPQSPARAVVVGVVLAVLVVGGAALAGALKPTLPSDWGNNSLVVGKTTGARYLALNNKLYPVVNTVSARLMVAPEQKFKVVFAPESELEDKPRGPTIGILGAPDALPEPGNMVQSSWVSCLDDEKRTRTTITSNPAVRGAGQDAATVVEVHGVPYVVTGGHRYEVQGSLDDTMLALGLEGQDVLEAPGTWAELFPVGSALDTVEVPEAGEPVPSRWHLPSEVSALGSVLEVEDGDGEPQRYLLRRNGRVLLTDTAYAMYDIAVGDLAEPVRVDKSDLAGVDLDGKAKDQPYPDDWPAALPTPLDEPDACAQLESGVPGESGPDVRLVSPRPALPTDGSAIDPLPQGGHHEVVVEPGAGALVRSMSGNDPSRGTVFLVDSTGTRFAVGGPEHSEGFVRGQLDYGDVEPTAVLPAWLESLPSGPELNPADAARRVTPSGDAGGG